MKKLMPNHPLSIFQIILKTVQFYGVIFPHIVWLVVISSVGHWIIPTLLILNFAYGGVATVGFICLTWFLYPAILNKSQIVLQGGTISTSKSLHLATQCYLSILGSNIIFFAMAIFLILIEFTLNLAFDLIQLHPIYLIVSIILNLIVTIYFYFSVPIIALDKVKLLTAFGNSVKLVRHHWWRTFIILAFVGAIILGFEALGILFSGTNRMILFTAYHFILQLIFYPLIISVTITLLNDLKLRINQPTH